ncbi:MAG: Rpn family recombination-promoting nuclease/putative transposase [Myxococcota bacterium]
MPSGPRYRNPHDALVRYVFSRPEAVAIELRHVVDPALHPFIDFESIRPLPTVDSNAMLDTSFADLRFLVDLVDQEVRVPLCLAFEHQSTLDLLLACRTLDYMGSTWRQFMRDDPKRTTVPAILPIVLLQRPACRTPRKLSELFSLTPTLRQRLGPTVELNMLVDDLSGSVLGDSLARPGPLALVEIARALLHAYRNLSSLTLSRLESLAPQFDLVLEQEPPLGIEDMRALWTYVITVFKPNSPLRELILESVSRKAKEMYRTIADELRDEGIAQGRTEGRTEGIALALLDVLDHRTLPISKNQREQVLAIRDEDVLRQWLGRAFTIGSTDELFDAGR